MNISRIVLGLMLIVGAAGALAVGGTTAFFSDTEISTGNTFTAGAIDLLVDNESYSTNTEGDFVFDGSLSWGPANLNDGETTIHKFFDFGDLKPDDEGEDTISLHVQNDAYACMDVTLTSNDDTNTTEPEGLVDPAAVDAETDEFDGELAQNIQMFWWADDGDNVYETGEETISAGIKTLYNLAYPNAFSVALADSLGSIWSDNGPIPADVPRFIGKMWCFGTLAEAPLDQDGQGKKVDDPDTIGVDESKDPLVRGTGFTCDGTALDNTTQTDEALLDIEFRAVQARHNETFRCIPPEETTITLLKTVINDDLGTALDTAWTLTADGSTDISGTEGSPNVTNAIVAPGAYTLGETGGPVGYIASQYSCVINGGAPVLGNNIVLAEGDDAVCTITNDDLDTQACTPTVRFADAAGTFDQGKQKEGDPVLANRSVPSAAFGAPQTTGTPTDAGFPVGSFVSLGFVGTSTATASLVLEFTNNVVVNGAGADMRLYEVTGGVYPDEHVKVEISQDGTTWFTAVADGVRDVNVDINGVLPWAKFVRVTDLSNPALFPADADGYDVDALEALNCAVPGQVI